MYNIKNQELTTVLSEFVDIHKLTDSYTETVKKWYLPILENLVNDMRSNHSPLIIGINGCQGSGKSTLADLIVHVYSKVYDKRCVAISIDDFYLTLEERKQLANRVHPLFLTRGVPGTHDIALANSVLDQLTQQSGSVKVPRFNKAVDNRAPENEWPIIDLPVDVIILEGWCLGAVAQEDGLLKSPINELEEFEDRSGIWRDYANECLRDNYQELFSRINYWIMLKAPSFDSVFQWRLEQEQKLEADLKGMDKFTSKTEKNYSFMSPQQIRRFIQYYQRITEHSLAHLPEKCDCVFQLNDSRIIQNIQQS